MNVKTRLHLKYMVIFILYPTVVTTYRKMSHFIYLRLIVKSPVFVYSHREKIFLF